LIFPLDVISITSRVDAFIAKYHGAMSRTISLLAALGGTWLWYGGVRLASRLAEPMLSSQRILFAGLGAVLPLPTRVFLTLDDLHVPLLAAMVTTVLLIFIERIFQSAVHRDLVHCLVLTLLIGYSAFSTVAILVALGNIIEKIR
jgi:hypothetical protein